MTSAAIEDETITYDEAGTFSCHLTLPNQVGNFYLSWDNLIHRHRR